MKNRICYICFLSIASLIFSKVNGQTIEEPERIEVIASVQNNNILLRWAPTTPIAWKQLNLYGYTIQRFTVLRDGVRLDQPKMVTLTSTPLLPEPLEDWISNIEENDNAAIIAQAIYGDSFQVGDVSKMEAIIAESTENEQRHTFALYAADRDFKIAQKAALGFVDNTALSNEKYIYRIISNVPPSLNDIAYGGTYIGLNDERELPAPLDFAVVFENSGAMLSWNYKLQEKLYTSYHIERSMSGEDFERINKLPYSKLNQNGSSNSGRIFYVDSITSNRMYQYRIQGQTIFGELSPYSKIEEGTSGSALAYTPHLLTKTILQDNKTVELTWEFDKRGEQDLQSFSLNIADPSGKTLRTVMQDIPTNSRKVSYTNLEGSTYFTITAIGKGATNTTSFPMLVQPKDETPPAPPSGLTGVIDSSGVVTLKWTKNQEKDFFGYRVFKGNLKGEEFSAQNAKPIQKEIFIDTVSIENLNSKVYYKLVALDNRYNQSEFSQTLELKKPDVIPPTSPVFKKFEVKDGVVFLKWAKSSSNDALLTQLYRKENDSPEWLLIYEGENGIQEYQDKNVNEGTLYSYTLLARDESNLESSPSPSISIVIPKTLKNKQIKNFYGSANKSSKQITLTWSYKSDTIKEFEIYKSESDKPLRLLRVVPHDTRLLYDSSLKINTEYTYGIRVILKDGYITKLKKIKIKY